MPLPRAVARDLRKTATAISRITDPIVSAAAERGVELASSSGGSFRGRALTASVRDVSNARGRSSARLVGSSAGAWSIKSYGRRGGYLVRPRQRSRRRALDLRRAGTPMSAAASARPGAARGDDRWQRLVVEPLGDEFAELAGELVGDLTDG